jgi:ribosomal protein S12 methylthiotransferase
MVGLAEQAGHTITTEASNADVLVVNTCAFIDSAKQESIDAILQMAEHRRIGRCRRLVVTGCLAERYRDALRAEIPEIDALLGTGQVPEIVSAVETSPAWQAQAPGYLYDADTPRHLATPGHFAYIKIAEGCSHTCSFCIIPALRGRYRSRRVESIVREARLLAARGVREIILISQDTTCYGLDLGRRGALAALLRELNGIDELIWIRLLYLYPTAIRNDVLDAMATCEKVCRYVDLPLQHVSNRVLKRMGRPGTRASYERLLARVRRRVPGVALRTTFIVGFPGETDRDVDELESFVRTGGFDHVGVFPYSHEEGTRAFAFVDDVPARTKRARRARIMRLQQQLVGRRQRARRGEIIQVLVDGPSAEHPLVLQGRLEGQAPEIDSVVYLTDCDPAAYPAGRLVRAVVTGASGYDLAARPLS